MSDMIELRTDNIDSIHQYDLMIKLRMASHPIFFNQEIITMIQSEINNRKSTGNWI